jgi:hypothetical protein
MRQSRNIVTLLRSRRIQTLNRPPTQNANAHRHTGCHSYIGAAAAAGLHHYDQTHKYFRPAIVDIAVYVAELQYLMVRWFQPEPFL